MSVSEQTKAVSNYITRRYGPGTNRHWRGTAHRRWLLDSGRYVRSGEQRSARAGIPMGLRVIGEAGPELVNLPPVLPAPPKRDQSERL